MNYFILATHSDFSLGMKNTVKMLTGIDEQVSAFSLYEGDSVKNLRRSIEIQIDNYKKDDKILIITDIPGGSVNNILLDKVENENIFLLSGLNLPLILNLVLLPEINKESIESTIEISREAIVCFKEEELKLFKEEDFFD